MEDENQQQKVAGAEVYVLITLLLSQAWNDRMVVWWVADIVT